ncbi:chemotaxis protein CheW [Methanolobus sediminis]|uniref:Chemotaxis protein CheW n=1 Tax=Methanolobus sediminis TaxID=3072978 RepID=A0AA51UKY2_9EURY|nr:chemotaxis protein CheW [Methanolobus sediminis]WMW25477.1 chemotaxis protein CheW [Methanolobus sediminis]
MEEFVKDGSSTEELLQLVICQLSDEEFGIDISRVKEIIRVPEITNIPQTLSYVEGMINLRGCLVPVIDLAKRFGLMSSTKDASSRIVVVELGNLTAGMIVDSVTEVLRISTDDIDKAPDIITKGVSERYIQGVGKIDGRLLVLLDIERVFTDEQKKMMSNLESAGIIPA